MIVNEYLSFLSNKPNIFENFSISSVEFELFKIVNIADFFIAT